MFFDFYFHWTTYLNLLNKFSFIAQQIICQVWIFIIDYLYSAIVNLLNYFVHMIFFMYICFIEMQTNKIDPSPPPLISLNFSISFFRILTLMSMCIVKYADTLFLGLSGQFFFGLNCSFSPFNCECCLASMKPFWSINTNIYKLPTCIL